MLLLTHRIITVLLTHRQGRGCLHHSVIDQSRCQKSDSANQLWKAAIFNNSVVMLMVSIIVTSIAIVSGQSLDEYKCSFCVGSVDEAMKSKSTVLSSCSKVFPTYLCDKFNISFDINSSLQTSRDVCEKNGLCEPITRHSLGDSGQMDIRISKAHGSRGYDKVRVSVISKEAIASPLFSYSERFQYRWTDNYLNTGILSVAPGETTSFTVGSESFEVYIPAQGEGTRGVIIADPCFTSEFVTCLYGREFDMYNHTIELLNAIHAHDDTHFWMILGDNFYDQSGEPTTEWFSALSKETKSKVMASVPGNHDFWVNGSPQLWTEKDQLGNGFMQWFAQDSAASIASTDETPFDFSADPDSDDADASTIPPLSNYFWYYMMGNVGFVGYSGAHTYEETLPYIQDACTWASGQNMDALILLGHWNSASFGCDADMTVSAVFESMRAEPACAGVADRMKYFVGHSHCNIVLEENTGFMVGGQGMSDTHCGGDFGIPVLDTTGGRLKVYFFPIQQHRGYTYYQDTLQCIKNNGISGCYNMATLWADVPLSYITAGTSLQQLAK